MKLPIARLDDVSTVKSAGSDLALVAALAEPLAGHMVAAYTLEDWQDSPVVDRVREAAEALATGGLEVPLPVREVLRMAAEARRPAT